MIDNHVDETDIRGICLTAEQKKEGNLRQAASGALSPQEVHQLLERPDSGP